MKKEIKIINAIIILWLILLTLFVIIDTLYDREIQRLDMKLDEANINFHEEVIRQFQINIKFQEAVIKTFNTIIGG